MSSKASSADNPYIDVRGRTDADLYLMGILDGSVIAGEKMKKLAEKMLTRIDEGYKDWHYDADAATRPVEFIERFCYMPSGKLGVPFILEPYERTIVELTFGFVDEEYLRQFQYVLIEMARKCGKALSLDTEIPTPGGWKLMRDVHVGDYVFGQDGKPAKVLVESEIFDKPMYLVTFEDGSTIKASGDHIWTVQDTASIVGWKGMTTEELASAFVAHRYVVPACEPIQYPFAELARDPLDVGVDVAIGRIDSIPTEYLTSSVDQRRELAVGVLLNTPRPGVNWSFSDERLCRDVAGLEASLGMVADVARDGDTWQLWVKEGWYGKYITSIEMIPNEPSKCIAVDNDNHLFLAGRQYTATHNTSLGAAIELYMLMADGEGAPQVYNAATSKGQASLAFGAAWRMVRQSPKLRKRLRKGTVVERAESGIINDDNFGYAIPLSKQSDHLDGLDVSFALLDEMAAMEDRATFDLVKQGTGARSQPLMMAITTQGFVRGGLWDAERNYAVRWLNDDIEDDRFLAMLYELDDRSEIWDERMWVKANPGIDTVKKREYLRAQVVKAKNDSNYMPTLLTKDFNLPANQATAFLTFEEACNSATYDFDPEVFRYCIVGIDAADTLDLNCATALFMRPGDPHIYRKSMYWIAEEQVKVNSNSQRQRDGVPYDIWAANGYIRIVPGNVVSHRCFLDWVQELADMGMYTRAIGFDRWGMREIVQDMKMMVGEQNVVPIPFGAQSLSGPMKELKAMMRDGLIVDGDNPIDHWCNLNVTAKVDINDNVQPIKKGGPTTRIDGFAALLCAYKVLRERWDDYQILIGEDLED